MRRACVGLTAALCLVTADAGATDACDSAQPEAGAPVRVPLGPADFGMVPEACPATAIMLAGRTSILIAEDDFYGMLLAGAGLRGRIELPGGSWFSAQLPGYSYRFVANATVEAESNDVSASTLGYHVPLSLRGATVAPYVRLMLPTETAFEHTARWGIEQGISSVVRAGRYFELMVGYAMPMLLTSNQATTRGLLMPTAIFDVGVRPAPWFEGVLGASVRVATPDEEPFESLDPRAALRFYPKGGLHIEANAAMPVLGRDRTNAAVGLSIGWISLGETGAEAGSKPAEQPAAER
jgi:hypothetical protein